MAQELTPALNTNVAAPKSGWSAFGDFLSDLAKPAASLYALKLQGDQLRQQSAATVAQTQAQLNAAQASATNAQANTTTWLVLGGVILSVIVALAFIFRRK